MIKLSKFFPVLILMAVFWQACDFPSQAADSNGPQIADIYFDYNQPENTILIQVMVEGHSPASTTVTVTLKILPDMTQQFDFQLNDDGLNGDMIAGNGSYSVSQGFPDVSAVGTYLYRVEVTDNSGTASQSEYLTIEAQVAPQILSVEMPQWFVLDPTLETGLQITCEIYDPNGWQDIKWLRYYINTDAMFLDNPATQDCDRDWVLSNSGYISDPSWIMDYTGPGSAEDTWLFSTIIPMRPVDACGGTGDAFFKFLVKDQQNLTDSQEDFWLGITGCGDGFCSGGPEDEISCPEDCE